MLSKALLRCFIVVWRYHKNTVGIAPHCTLSKSQRFLCVITAYAGNYLHSAVVVTADKFYQCFVFVLSHRSIFTGGATDNYRRCTVIVLKINKLLHLIKINAMLIKGCDYCSTRAFKYWCFNHKLPPIINC